MPSWPFERGELFFLNLGTLISQLLDFNVKHYSAVEYIPSLNSFSEPSMKSICAGMKILWYIFNKVVGRGK